VRCLFTATAHILSEMYQRRNCFSAIILLSVLPLLAQQTLPNTKADRIDRLVSLYSKYGYFNGSILVAEHGNVIYRRGVGYSDFALHKPNTPQTKFDIASITKQFTAALILLQAADGKLRLNATVSEILPWYRKDTGSRMTIEQLLRHTSGLPPDYDAPEFGDGQAAAQHDEPQPFAEKVCQPALVSEPGAKWNYSNCGYALLGLILERVTGRPFEVLLQTQLLQPLGMNDSGLDHNNLESLGGAVGYKRHAGPRYMTGPYIDRTHIFSAGSMYSTVEDLYRWNQALSNGDLFPKEVRAKIFNPGLGDWGYGWFVTKIPLGTPGEGSMMAEMRGDMPSNFFAWILRYPEQDDVVIVLRNGYGSTENLEQNLQAILFDREPRLPKRSPVDLAAHVGWISLDWIVGHRVLSATAVVLLVLFLFRTARKRKSSV
jgi:CubicO group peptidase (beta-lactamase class C family)